MKEGHSGDNKTCYYDRVIKKIKEGRGQQSIDRLLSLRGGGEHGKRIRKSILQ